MAKGTRGGKRGATASAAATTQEEYLGKLGLSAPMSDYMIDKVRIPHGETQRAQDRRMREANRVADEYQERRGAAIREYQSKIKSGELTEKSALQVRLDVARGQEDNASVQAARRRLEKQGIDWRTGRKRA